MNINSYHYSSLQNIEWFDPEYISEQIPCRQIDTLYSLIEQELSPPQFHPNNIELASKILDLAISPLKLRFNRWFDADTYVSLRPDIANANINPSLHYFSTGHKECDPNYFFSLPSRRLEQIRIKSRLIHNLDAPEHLQSALSCPSIKRAKDLSKSIENISRDKAFLLFSFSHDNPYLNSGGVQKVIREETQKTQLRNGVYVHISPTHPRPYISDTDNTTSTKSVEIHVNGQPYGSILEHSIPLFVYKTKHQYSKVVIHHIYGFSVYPLALAVRDHARLGDAYFWIHDYATSCPNYTLLKNRTTFCGSPIIDHAECSYCEYSLTRKTTMENISIVTTLKGLKFIYPSYSAKHVSSNGFSVIPSNSTCHVIPHCDIERFLLREKKIQLDNRKCKVAFAGMPVLHKGWDEFLALSSDPRLYRSFEWFHIGKNRSSAHMKYIEADGISSTIKDALINHEIDIVFIWSLWPETFCLTAYEAFMAKCHIITNPHSGNVAQGLPYDSISVYHSIDNLFESLLKFDHERLVTFKHCVDIQCIESDYSLSLG